MNNKDYITLYSTFAIPEIMRFCDQKERIIEKSLTPA